MERLEQLEFVVDLIYDVIGREDYTIIDLITNKEEIIIYSLDKDLKERVLEIIDTITEI